MEPSKNRNPPASQGTEAAVRQAMHIRDAPAHVAGADDMFRKGMGAIGAAGGIDGTGGGREAEKSGTGSDVLSAIGMTSKEGVEGGRKS
ncbi:hypothetical protein DRE_06071 [Drechslerella stenobrocha 248]|uniref:Uncharacterized protein n=1 Tax=Drechslerella stenobrocha 248 TaxID=1043628 RepID=W7HZ13_9PEZI|nr:hypothetical protein DRE_06071 [Drechslerella stenobrocha 248]